MAKVEYRISTKNTKINRWYMIIDKQYYEFQLARATVRGSTGRLEHANYRISKRLK
jgi:hypothetical protein